MTLIYSLMGPELGLITVSDILTSRSTYNAPNAVDLPLRRNSLPWANDRYVSAGVEQKTVVFGRMMIQWAGDVEYARRFIRTLYTMSFAGRINTPLSAVESASGLSQAGLTSIQIISHFRENPWICHRQHHRCDEIKMRHGTLIIGGSGRDDFEFNSIVTQTRLAGNAGDAVREVFARSMRVIISGLLGDHSYEDAYGGWLEFGTTEGVSFSKVPVCIKCWEVRDGVIDVTPPLFFSTYVGYRMVVCRVVIRSPRSDDEPDVTFTAVGDFLERPVDPKDVPNDISILPGIMYHLCINEGSTETPALIIQSPDDFGIKFFSKNGGLHWDVSGWLTERLVACGTVSTVSVRDVED